MAFTAFRIALNPVTPTLLYAATSLPASVWILPEAGLCLIGDAVMTQDTGQHIPISTPFRYDLPKNTSVYGLSGLPLTVPVVVSVTVST